MPPCWRDWREVTALSSTVPWTVPGIRSRRGLPALEAQLGELAESDSQTVQQQLDALTAQIDELNAQLAALDPASPEYAELFDQITELTGQAAALEEALPWLRQLEGLRSQLEQLCTTDPEGNSVPISSAVILTGDAALTAARAGTGSRRSRAGSCQGKAGQIL